MADEVVTDQAGFRVRFGWDPNDTALLAPRSDLVVVADVLRFRTAVTVAVERGAFVYPYRWLDDTAREFAASVGSVLADGADQAGPSLSPVSLQRVDVGERLVLPSPNGATLTLLAAECGPYVVAGSLCNASAVAERSASTDGVVTVIAAGERWPDGGLRPCVEDLVGVGAILAALSAGDLSPEAPSAVAAFEAARSDLPTWLAKCSSGRELIAKGFEEDVAMATDLDSSTAWPVLRNGAYCAD
jgi:2-phosphosulfolactate phosphatase